MRASIRVFNTPMVIEDRFVVARRDDKTAELWYWGQYDDEQEAYRVAKELDNGVVIEPIREGMR